MRDPNIFVSTGSTFEAAVGPEQAKELTSDGNFYRTLWHEVGHYLGVDRTKDNRDLDEALQENASALEEMKADLVSLCRRSLRSMLFNDAQLRSVYAGGSCAVLQNNKPRRDHHNPCAMQWTSSGKRVAHFRERRPRSITTVARRCGNSEKFLDGSIREIGS